MSEFNEWAELKETLKLFTVWAVSSIIDSAFVALWAVVQYLVNHEILPLVILTGIDLFVLKVFQILFTISTLAPIIFTIYKDIRIMYLRTQRKIQNEIKFGDYDEPEPAKRKK